MLLLRSIKQLLVAGFAGVTEGQHAKLQDFIEPVKRADYGSDLKNLYNLYIYFWRWALWKVIEEGDGSGPGIVSFITASSYLEGNAFIGMREHMRRTVTRYGFLI